MVSTLSALEQADLARLSRGRPRVGNFGPEDIQLGGERFLSTSVDLTPGSRMEVSLTVLESYDQALHDDDGLISAWYNKGSLLHELGRDQEALLAFDKAIALDPHYISAWNNKGLALFKLGHLDEALVAFDQATSFAPEEPDAWHNKAIVLEKLGRVEEAVSCQEWAQSLEQQVAG